METVGTSARFTEVTSTPLWRVLPLTLVPAILWLNVCRDHTRRRINNSREPQYRCLREALVEAPRLPRNQEAATPERQSSMAGQHQSHSLPLRQGGSTAV